MDPITKLFSYMNHENSQDTYYRLAEFTLQHTNQLATLSISEFAEATFVSQATITRFIHFLGFENYLAFKKFFLKLSQTTKQSFLKLSAGEVAQVRDEPDHFFEHYTNLIIQSIQDTADSLQLNEVEQLIDAVFAADNVAFLGYSDSNTIAKDIQLGALAAHKKIEVAESEQKFDDILHRFTENDLIVILSNYGNFFRHYQHFYEALLTTKIPLILVTQHFYSMDSFGFKQTIYLTSKRSLNVGNYPMRIFSEYFVRRLLCRTD